MSYLNGGLFESAGEWIHPKRTVESNELIYVSRGRVFIEGDGKSYVLEENDILFLEKGKTHFGTEARTGCGTAYIRAYPPALSLRKQSPVSAPYA